MEKINLKVPYGIQYISEWKNYDLPIGHVIVDKGVTGCGYTEYCLRNNHSVILCSPRKLLLENKFEQHQKEGNWNVLYLVNENEDESNKISGLELERNWTTTIFHHLQSCKQYGVPPKILVTYDSLYHLLTCLKNLVEDLDNYFFIVDEFQSIFLDAFFKASTEFNFVEYLQDCPNVLYLSATPMLDKYLDKVDEFKDLDFYELDWSESGCVENIKITSKKIYSISGECKKIISKFQKGKYPIALDLNGKPVESKEAVFYLNSVSDIIRTIKSSGLVPSEVNIICSGTKDNKDKLSKLSKSLGYTTSTGFKLGKVPLRGERNKKFTFCTRAVYMGADFYSKCASSYVFADPNIKCLALDISMDLPQIVGRQRDRENPFKNTISIFYKTTTEIQTREEFEVIQDERRNETRILLEGFQNLTSEQQVAYTKKLRDGIEVSKYSDDFVSISNKTGQPVHNHFIELAHERSWEISQKDYQDQISVTKVMEDKGYTVTEEGKYIQEDPDFLRFKSEFESTSQFSRKLKIYCEYLDQYKDNLRLSGYIMFYVKEPKYQKYYSHYGTSGCKAKKFREQELELGLKSGIDLVDNLDIIYNSFQIGEKYSTKVIKSILKDIYSTLGISRTPKAKDLEEYFIIESAKIPNSETGKRENGFKIISRR